MVKKKKCEKKEKYFSYLSRLLNITSCCMTIRINSQDDSEKGMNPEEITECCLKLKRII